MLVALVVVSGLAFLAGWSSVLSSSGKPLVPVVGRVSASLPSSPIPESKFPWVRELGGSALAVAVLGLLEALAIARGPCAT
jgi:sulfate permease, SulP family